MAAPFKGKRGKSERGKGERVKKWLRLLTGEQVNSPNRQLVNLLTHEPVNSSTHKLVNPPTYLLKLLSSFQQVF